MVRHEVKCAGFGGQGIALMGRIIGVAASIYEKPAKNSVFTQSYGPESRGGASSANIVIETEPGKAIEFPYVIEGNVDSMIIMSKESYSKYIPFLKKGGTVFIDPDMVGETDNRLKKAGKIHIIPATALAEEVGRRIVANIVMTGFISDKIGVISKESIKEAMLSRVPPKFRELNERAFNTGLNYKPE